MTIAQRRPFGQNYAWVVAGITFLSLLAAAGLRSAPGVLLTPLHQTFGWERGQLSAAAAIGIFLYGLVGPFAAALMQTLGLKRTLLAGLVLMSGSTALSLSMTEPWQYLLTWGVLSGFGSGAVALAMGATVVNRWFVKQRGLVMGLLSASTATGSLIFLPGMAALAQTGGWQPVVIAVSLVAALLVPLVFFLMPERPSDIGQPAYGGTEVEAAPPRGRAGDAVKLALSVLVKASRNPAFWLLFATFFVCGFTTNGLVGTHLISYCGDNGLALVQAGALLAAMGAFDIVGTTASGWLTDRYDPRKLLFVYYALRGLSLMALPFLSFDVVSLSIFAVFYGLDWLATVPPTVKLATESFGEREGPIVFGWIAFGHQVGAATAAFGAGVLRDIQGNYMGAFIIAGCLGIVAACAALMIRRPGDGPAATPVPA
ncbi:MAG: MFS transporter [Alphaproteobacteria bacterium]|nr:MFS transporter [Alphaproteobacteria bacterium]MBU1514213.1 MFS transporter [Alphaproteobacteria bacterium]MBU2095887.1 MFS transporter [Alphaproteobacteria bacterium]MBU2151629.1 MFS transporter [Alphaproteobacteria bacterium]MBU2307123.1 MFS transporter [Alphaproteobacteria bacterium]